MHVWDRDDTGSLHFDCAELGEPCLGYIIEPRIIEDALWQRLQASDTVTLLCPQQVTGVTVGADAVAVELDSGETLEAALLVAADGARSPLRERLGMETHGHDYRQSSLVARVQTTEPHRHTAWQRFLPGGPLAFLPMQDHWCSIVWTVPANEIESLLSLEPNDFHAELAEAFAHRLGDISDSGERESWPLQRLHATRYIQPRVALAGDAAHAIHPLAGQGVNLGLLDAASLAEVVIAARGRGRDPGSEQVLRRYERWRRGDNVLMMMAMDGINSVFSRELSALGQLRGLGLSLVNRSSLARERLMRHAMGLGGDLPSLARGIEEISLSG
jgi:2-octaprenylphenol hydroxylase